MRFFKWLFALLVLFSITARAQKKSGKQPNIILILADDLGYADLGCYGQQKTETPNIDRLAKNGLQFLQFYAGTTVCAPSRASLLSGLHTGHTAVRGNEGYQPEGQTPLPDSVITIATLLRDHGYETAAFGKWGLGYITTSGDPNKKGFDQFFGYNCQSLAHNYFPDHLWNNHERIDFPENATANAVYSADYIHAHAMQFLRQPHKKPFFLYLPYTLPHGDVIAPRDSVYNYYVKKFNEAPRPEKPDERKPYKPFEPYPHAAFAAMVSRLDKYVGEILEMVHEKGISNNTLILFTSDNGPHREDGGDPDFFDGNGIYRGIKRDVYEGGIRVPFIASWRGVIPYGAVNNQPLAMWDLFPTFQQLALQPVSKNIDGISILPALTGKKQPAHNYLYWEFHEQGGKQAILWKN